MIYIWIWIGIMAVGITCVVWGLVILGHRDDQEMEERLRLIPNSPEMTRLCSSNFGAARGLAKCQPLRTKSH